MVNMVNKENIGIAIIILNIGGLGFIAVYFLLKLKKLRNKASEKAELAASLASLEKEKNSDGSPESEKQKRFQNSNLLDDIDLSEFDDWKLDDFD